MNESKFEHEDYKRSRRAYVVQCTVEYFIILLVTDAFLTSLLTYMGISDSVIGIIASLTTLAFTFQLLSLFIIQINISTRALVIAGSTIGNLAFTAVFLVPFIPCGREIKAILVTTGILIAYLGRYAVVNICYKWGNSFVSPAKRGSFSAVKEMISLLTGIVFTLFAGYVTDKFESLGNIEGAFIFLSVTILILNICNFISLMMIKNEKREETTKRDSFADVIKALLQNKDFINITAMGAIWECAKGFSIGFMGTYKYKELAMSVLFIQIINMVSQLARLLVSKPLGKYTDNTSYAKGLELGIIIASVSFATSIFARPGAGWLLILHTILYNVSLAGTSNNATLITYNYVEENHLIQAMAVKNCIGGLAGFFVSLIAAKLLDFVQTNGNSIFGIQIYGQQLLSAISLILSIVSIIYIRKVINKMKVKIQ